ncbi:MAG: DNA-binding transcriptional LysR family regulator [Polyangiales bacterium]|jgi:DNA-binding transcriptional LysR family regulator
MTIQFHRLDGFYWVAREGGYAAAARAFPYPITQPGVHAQVRKLEAEIGARLVERVAHDHVTTTSAGADLFAFCAPFFEGLDAAIHHAVHAKQVLRIDAGQLELAHLLPEWIHKLRSTHSELEVQLFERETPDFERLRTGQVDLAIDHFDEVPPDLESRVVAQHMVFLLSPSSSPKAPAKRARKASPAKVAEILATNPFVGFPSGSRERRIQLGPLQALGMQPDIRASASTVMGILSLVRAGLGVSLVPWPTKAGPHLDGVTTHRVDAEGASFPIHALWSKQRTDVDAIHAALAAGGVRP